MWKVLGNEKQQTVNSECMSVIGYDIGVIRELVKRHFDVIKRFKTTHIIGVDLFFSLLLLEMG